MSTSKEKRSYGLAAVDNLLLGMQERLCAARLTHRADQIDILRRSVGVVIGMAQDDKMKEGVHRGKQS